MGKGHPRTIPVYKQRLGLEEKPRTFENLKNFINEFIKEHGDCASVGSEQPKLYKELGVELLVKFPKIFGPPNNEDKLKAARSLAMCLHGRRREILNKSRTRIVSKSKEIIVIDDSSEDELPRMGREIIPTPKFPKKEFSSTVQSMGGARYIVPRPEATTQSSTTASASQEVQDPIYKFLNECVPSMRQFYKAFVNYGCKNEEYLVAVAGWSAEQVLQFLRNVASNTNGAMTEMDIQVLQHHLANYPYTLDSTRS
ncbi:hypothetical protein CPB83DRAFT_847115 [Crepidotus variabilis]|uniref:Uncharacterized protein n=1 Tax=Crepidotus variabilis TaxID=179855 RepID=A0A9P6EP84_9AGAR|nr:hypothetical protein CPB83DRAFT_847115 [Crepidotus variabilis]